MGRICFKIDDNYEQILRQQAAHFHLSISEFIRQKILNSTEFSTQNNFTTAENVLKLQAEVLELRKELRLVTGALIKILESNGLSVEQMKLAAKEFFKERV